MSQSLAYLHARLYHFLLLSGILGTCGPLITSSTIVKESTFYDPFEQLPRGVIHTILPLQLSLQFIPLRETCNVQTNLQHFALTVRDRCH
jgi:hypothetical protein